MKLVKCAVALILVCGMLLTGCGGNGGETVSDELTYWVALNSNVAASVSSLGDTPFAKALEEATGVKIKYIHPTLGNEEEAFNLMVASNELADIVEYSWSVALGGPQTAIADGVIQPLNDYMKDSAPALSKYLNDNPDIDKAVKTDDGQYYVFPFVRGHEKLLLSAGPIVRKDWLDDLGLKAPTTIEEWEVMLRRFKEEKGATAPLTLKSNQKSMLFALLSASTYYYNDNGTVKYGPLQPEYKEALSTLNRWFKEGLLDKNYTMVDGKIQDSNIMNDQSGATFGSGGSGLGKWMETMASKNPGYSLIGVPYPSIAGVPAKNIPVSIPWGGSGAAITTACKDIKTAMKFLDYSYTEAGSILNNFGIEGESFTYVDGEPIYTDKLMKNPDGLNVSQAMGLYNRANYLGPFVQDVRYIEQYYATQLQQDALTAWLTGPDSAKSKAMPTITLSPEETTEFAKIDNEATKYVSESTAAFISGSKSLDEYDEFVETLKKLHVDRATEIYQAAVTRYGSRK